jgi:hypothetical protein
VESAERPDEKDDREGYTDQPEQKTSTHNFLLFAGSPPNVMSKLTFPACRQVCRPEDCTVADQQLRKYLAKKESTARGRRADLLASITKRIGQDETKSPICVEELHSASWHAIRPINRQ